MLHRETDWKESYEGKVQFTGAPIVQKMIAHALARGDQAAETILKDIMSPIYDTSNDSSRASGELISILKYFPPKSPIDEGADKVLRVSDEYYTAENNTPENPITENPSDILEGILDHEPTTPAVIVLYDRNSRLRGQIQSACSDPKKNAKLKTILSKATASIIAIRDGIEASHAGSWLMCLKEVTTREKTLVIVHADSLRKCGLNITEYGSVEQVVNDIKDNLEKYPIKNLMEMSADLVVVFRETATLHLKSDSTGGSLHICPNFARNAQADPRRFGVVPGKFTTLLAALVRHRYLSICEQPTGEIDSALRLGIAGYNLLFNEGLEKNVSRNIYTAFDAMERVLSLEHRKELKTLTEKEDKPEFLIASLTLPPIKQDWSRIDAVLPKGEAEEQILETAREIVKLGLGKVLRHKQLTPEEKVEVANNGNWFPRAVIKCPYVEFGKIKSIDPNEITKFIPIGKLIRKYLDTPHWSTPLSIAVFGKPGSGKSFAVKQILASIDPGRRSDPLTFNLAQFSGVEQLTEAFHKVQDQALAAVEVPLVIFDEFDCYFASDLGWLKYFLAPMQDGLFRGKTQDYRVGRAIFLFSGGTSDTFQEFEAQKIAGSGIEENQEILIRRTKRTDFISRLRGHLDIDDINRNSEKKSSDGRVLALRRATILRSLLSEHAKPIMREDENGHGLIANILDPVIDAFLNAITYVHGVRSMEAIIQMSRWIDGQFVPASLPAQDQLKNHVDPSFYESLKK